MLHSKHISQHTGIYLIYAHADGDFHIDQMPKMVVSVATLYWQMCYSVWKIHILAIYDTKCFQGNILYKILHILHKIRQS